jgi:YidC/Oxa1 family membrane protein insertase
MDRRTLLAVLISFGIFLAWQKFVLEKYQQQPMAASSQAAVAPSATVTQQPVSERQQSRATPTLARESLSIGVDGGELKIGNGAQVLEGWSYRTARESINASQVVGDLPQLDLTVDHGDYSFLGKAVGKLERRSETQWLWSYQNDQVSVERTLTANPKDPFIDVLWKLTFKKAIPKHAFVSLIAPFEAGAGEPIDRKLVYMAGDSVESVAANEAATLTDVMLPTRWIGVEDRYFLLGAVDPTTSARALVQPLPSGANRLSLVYPVAGESTVVPVRVYFGPKQSDRLKKVSKSLANAVDFGWLTVIAYPILKFMNWLFSFLRNYGLAIIVLTTVLKIVLYPLTYKSVKSMKQMASLQPQLQKLRERYANDKEALNREMLNLMRNHGYNPMAGCLPMLIQMPVFFALYRVLYGSFELYRAPFGLWITDLSAKDPWYVTPVLLTAVMYFQQKLTPNTATDPAQAKMIQWMPVIFGVFMLGLPAGLTIYMLTNAVVSIIQQVILNKKLGITPAATHASTQSR